MEQAILRSLGRRAMRAVRPHIQSIPREELWGVLFDESCLMISSERLAMAVKGRPLAAPLSILGWAEAKGARAIVLVQNQHGSRQAATPVALGPTLKIAATAHLHGMVLVDHIIIHATGSATQLRRGTALAEAQAFAIQLQTDLEDLAASHLNFGLPNPPKPTNPQATLP
jgi:RadC-like JAB domain-containing protein